MLNRGNINKYLFKLHCTWLRFALQFFLIHRVFNTLLDIGD